MGILAPALGLAIGLPVSLALGAAATVAGLAAYGVYRAAKG